MLAVDLQLSTTTPRMPILLELGSADIVAQVVRPATFRVRSLTVDPTIAKVRQGISVQASVKNVGDVSGTFPGSLKANGREVDAQPTPVAPGESTELSFRVSQGSAGRCRLQLGNARRMVVVVRPVRPPNGHILRRTVSNGNAHLTVKNANGLDAMVILTRTSSPNTAVLAMYVHGKSKATINSISDGSYILWDCEGRDWNTYMRDFLPTDEHSRWRDSLVFSTTSSTSYWSDAYYNYSQRRTGWTNYTLTLGHGSTKYSTVTSSRRFPKP